MRLNGPVSVVLALVGISAFAGEVDDLIRRWRDGPVTLKLTGTGEDV